MALVNLPVDILRELVLSLNIKETGRFMRTFVRAYQVVRFDELIWRSLWRRSSSWTLEDDEKLKFASTWYELLRGLTSWRWSIPESVSDISVSYEANGSAIFTYNSPSRVTLRRTRPVFPGESLSWDIVFSESVSSEDVKRLLAGIAHELFPFGDTLLSQSWLGWCFGDGFMSHLPGTRKLPPIVSQHDGFRSRKLIRLPVETRKDQPDSLRVILDLRHPERGLLAFEWNGKLLPYIWSNIPLLPMYPAATISKGYGFRVCHMRIPSEEYIREISAKSQSLDVSNEMEQKQVLATMLLR